MRGPRKRTWAAIVVAGYVVATGAFGCSERLENERARDAHDASTPSSGNAPMRGTGGSTTSGAGGAPSGGAGSSSRGGSGATPPTGSGGRRIPDAGISGTGGSVATRDSGLDGGGPTSSGLPFPPGSSSVAVPSGSTEDFRVLSWAGFRSAVTYSFDDSSPSQVDHYADLAATGVPLTFYITTSNASSGAAVATWKNALAAGHELGNHTVHHCNFDQSCNGVAAGSSVSEVDDASSYLRGTLGAPNVWTMAYPFGDTGYEALAKDRFFIARGVPGGTIKPSDSTDPWNLPIFGAVGGESASALDGHIDAAHTEGSWLIFLFHSIAPDNEAWYAPVDVANITSSIDHAKSLGDTWIDTVSNVGAYWLGQSLVEKGTVSGTSPRTRTWTLPRHFPPGKYVRVVVGGGTLRQGSTTLRWNPHGFYEVSLDAGTLTWTSQ